MTAEERIQVFESMPVHRAVYRQILPAVISQMIALIYNLADTYFVGLLNAPAQTAAVTVAYPSFLMLTAISNLFGVGGASAFSRALGKHDRDAGGEIYTASFWMALLSGAVYVILFACFRGSILRVSGATDETWLAVVGYTRWVILIGGIPVVLNGFLANMLRAEGNAARASFGVSLGGILNLILDPLMILPQFAGMGAAGAGLATAISNGVSVVYFLWITSRNDTDSLLRLRSAFLLQIRKHFREIVSIGFPSALQYALTVVAVAAQAKFVSQYPTQAVAALGITKKLDQLPLYFSIGVSSGLMPFLAFNHASGNASRRREAFRFGVAISLGFALFTLVLYESFAPFFASLFIRDEVTIGYAASFLRRMVVAMPLMSVCYPMIIQFQAMGRAGESLVCSVLRKGVLDIPLLFLMDALFPLYGLMWVQPIVDAVSLAVCVLLYYRLSNGKTVKNN